MFTEEWIEKIRNQASIIEQTGIVPDEIISWMFEQKLFKLFVSEELGGEMLALPDATRIIQQAAAIEGTIGWLTAIGAGGGMFAPNIEKEWSEKLFNQREAVIAGSGHPNGRAQKRADGFIVNGEWKFCSGAPFASFFTANSVTEDNEVVSFVFMPDQVEVVEDWNAFGLKGTGSHTIRVKDAFVPADRTFSIFEIKNEYFGPVHTFPFVQFSQASFTPVCLGIGEHFFDEAKQIAEKWSNGNHARFDKVMKVIQDQESLFIQATTQFYDEIDLLWSKHIAGETLQEIELETFSETCKYAVSRVIDGVNSLIRYLGMEAIMESSTLNRTWRDLNTAGQHTFITP